MFILENCIQNELIAWKVILQIISNFLLTLLEKEGLASAVQLYVSEIGSNSSSGNNDDNNTNNNYCYHYHCYPVLVIIFIMMIIR